MAKKINKPSLTAYRGMKRGSLARAKKAAALTNKRGKGGGGGGS